MFLLIQDFEFSTYAKPYVSSSDKEKISKEIKYFNQSLGLFSLSIRGLDIIGYQILVTQIADPKSIQEIPTIQFLTYTTEHTYIRRYLKNLATKYSFIDYSPSLPDELIAYRKIQRYLGLSSL